MSHYTFEKVTYSSNSSVTALVGYTYWYDSGTLSSSLPVYYDASGAYAYWFWAGSWRITVLTDVNTTPTNYYTLAGSAFSGFGTFTGSLTVSAYVISDAWYRAETEAFDSLKTFLGCTENDNCFRGFLPVMGDGSDYKYANVWQMTSGGSGQFDMERLQGEIGNWCSLRTDVRIESLWKSRQEAMEFAGAVLAWLKSTGNLGQTGNVTWCTLADIPSEPQEYITNGENRQRYWKIDVDLEIVYRTEDVF